MLKFDFELSDAEKAALAEIEPEAWFTRVEFANGASPSHPRWERLEQNNLNKQRVVRSWIATVVPGRSVLDTFSANGAFSFLSAEYGANLVVGVEFDAERVAAAELVAQIVENHTGTPPPGSSSATSMTLRLASTSRSTSHSASVVSTTSRILPTSCDSSVLLPRSTWSSRPRT